MLNPIFTLASVTHRAPISKGEVENIGSAGFTPLIFVRTVIKSRCFFDINNFRSKFEPIKTNITMGEAGPPYFSPKFLEFLATSCLHCFQHRPT